MNTNNFNTNNINSSNNITFRLILIELWHANSELNVKSRTLNI